MEALLLWTLNLTEQRTVSKTPTLGREWPSGGSVREGSYLLCINPLWTDSRMAGCAEMASKLAEGRRKRF